MSDLRDHSQPCKHKNDEPDGWPGGALLFSGPQGDGLWRCTRGTCPGGRQVTIDYEAAARKVHALMRIAFNQFPDESGKGRVWDDLDEISKVGLIAMARDRINASIGDEDREPA